MFRISILSLIVIMLSGSLFAGTPVWVSARGPEGGLILSIAVDPQDPSTVYAAAPGKGMYKSTNGGASWRLANSGIFGGTYRVVIDPQNHLTLYASADKKLFKSTDGARTWTDVGFVFPYFPVIVLDPTNSKILYASSFGPAYKSIDGGIS